MRELEQNQVKAVNTQTLLIEIIQTPNDFKNDEKLLKILSSQSALAKYSCPERNIVSCSLNTLIKVSDSHIDEGWKYVDTLRKNAKVAIEDAIQKEKKGKPNNQTVAGLKITKSNLEEQLGAMRFACFELTKLIAELRATSKDLVTFVGTSEERYERYKDKDAAIQTKLSHTRQNLEYAKFIDDYEAFLATRGENGKA